MTELDRDAVLRIAATVKKRGPGIVRRSHYVQRARPVALALAITGAVFALVSREEPEVVQVVPEQRDERACASWRDSPELRNGRIELRRALAILANGSDATVASLLPCSAVIALERGRIAIHARDLGGGELRVRVGTEDVVVRGTIFAVEREGDRIGVEVAEGRVAIGEDELVAGERMMKQGGSIARSALSRADVDALLAEVGISVERPIARDEKRAPRKKKIAREIEAPRRKKSSHEAQAPIETPNELMQRAQEARKGGDRDRARELFARAGRDLEAAWMSLARMELDALRPAAAIAALDERQRRFGEGALSIEAAWLRVRALDDSGDPVGARAEAKRIVERWPHSPYAAQAKGRLEKR